MLSHNIFSIETKANSAESEDFFEIEFGWMVQLVNSEGVLIPLSVHKATWIGKSDMFG